MDGPLTHRRPVPIRPVVPRRRGPRRCALPPRRRPRAPRHTERPAAVLRGSRRRRHRRRPPGRSPELASARISCQLPVWVERGGTGRPAGHDHLTGPERRTPTGRALRVAADQGCELRRAREQHVAPFDEREHEVARPVGPPESRPKVQVDRTQPTRAFQELERCGSRSGSEHRGDAGRDHRARLGDRGSVEVRRLERRGRRSAAPVSDAPLRVAHHQPRRTISVDADPSEVDPLRREGGPDALARGIVAEPADPRCSRARAGEGDERVALRAPVRRDELVRRREGSVAGHEGEHRLTQGDHVVGRVPVRHVRTVAAASTAARARSRSESSSASERGGRRPTRADPSPTALAPAAR